MKATIKELVNVPTLPDTTQTQLIRYLQGKTTLNSMAKLKCKRNKDGEYHEAFEIGLAYYIAVLARDFNENTKG